jgi:site-specific DNA-methyltransferase (adenine-specific)
VSRVEKIGNSTLYLGDCRDILPSLHLGGGSVVSDVPYGIDYQHSGGGKGNSRVRNSEAIKGDRAPFDPAHLLNFGNVLLWGADHFYRRLPDHGRWLAWNKLGGKERGWDSFADVEFAWHSKEGSARIFNLLWKGLARSRALEGNDRRLHPTQKPVELMLWCIEQAGIPARCIVCDPYMGSGTTGVAAIRSHRHFIGIELVEKYFDIACHRIEHAVSNPTLELA